MAERQTVLLIEENLHLSEVLTGLLNLWGYEVVRARSIGDIWQVVKRNQAAISALICDFGLVDDPASEDISALSSEWNLPKIIITGSLASENAASEFSAPVLPKPFHPYQLRVLLSEVLAGSSQELSDQLK